MYCKERDINKNKCLTQCLHCLHIEIGEHGEVYKPTKVVKVLNELLDKLPIDWAQWGNPSGEPLLTLREAKYKEKVWQLHWNTLMEAIRTTQMCVCDKHHHLNTRNDIHYCSFCNCPKISY